MDDNSRFYSIAIISSDDLKRSSEATRRSLYEVINQGYDVPRYKYGIITSPRIKSLDSLLDDLGFQAAEGKCWLYLLLNHRTSALTDFDDKLQRKPATNCDNHSIPAFFIPNSATLEEALKKEHILATIGFRPVDEAKYEITAFTSAAKGCGIKLFKQSVSILGQENDQCKTLLASIILEHDLMGYYEKLGFVEVSRSNISKKVDQQRVFADNVEFSRGFHVVQMEKGLE